MSGLKDLRNVLKQGCYTGSDIMEAWLAIDRLIVAEQRIKELESALSKFEQWFGGSKYRDILKWKEQFALEQQAKGVEDFANLSLGAFHNGASAASYIDQLRKQSEDL